LIKAELYSSQRPVVIVERGPESNAGAWARLQEAYSRGTLGGTANRIEVRADVFLAELETLRDVRQMFSEPIELGPNVSNQLKSLAEDRKAREAAPHAILATPEELRAQLLAIGFVRELKDFQLENLAACIGLPHSADFSVPGSGKTSVALANFALQRSRGSIVHALVVAPIAAFAAWKEDALACMQPAPRVEVHGGAGSVIPRNADILLTNYNRVALDYDRLREFVSSKPTQLFLDEAHRIKKGALGVHGRAVLDLAYAAKRRDILTGTPAPQGAYDMVALMRFLYPGQDHQILPSDTYNERDTREPRVLRLTSAAIRRYFVRTTKGTLDLPATTFDQVRRPMGSLQRAIYAALLGRYRGTFQLEISSRREFDRLGRIVMYLLEAATNPMLISAGSDVDDIGAFDHPPIELRGDEPLRLLLANYGKYETPWKYEAVAEIVKKSAESGQKVLVWSSFVRNIRALSKFLEEFAPAVVHGGIPAIDERSTPGVSRESELDRFRHDPQCSVLLANPAACGEGVSLHHWCHHAVYLDRTFNAGHFLQSQDRIHRLGLDKAVLTRFTILMSEESIDGVVDARLREKVESLSRLMDDPNLVNVALPQPDDATPDDLPTFEDDVGAVNAHLRSDAA
jgi:SNF2 family DNA or RNA helicase